MPAHTYDIITVGGGIAASALAKAMSERGAKVLVLERDVKFKDRVRGEALVCWGAGEARELGIYELLKESCGHEVPLMESGAGRPRDLTITTPQCLPFLSFPHQVMQETLLAAAEKAGAEVRRGVSVERIEPGKTPAVIIDGQRERFAARLVICADGRGSAGRKWARFPVCEQINDYYMAGVLLSNVRASTETIYGVFNPELGTWSGLIPLGGDRSRAYFVYPKAVGYRLQGDTMLSAFLRESARGYPAMADFYARAKSAGPLASFDASDDWVEHPYRDGVALVGDAAATTDPTYGQGLSFALRAARVLRDELTNDSDWEAAGHRYADQHLGSFRACHTVEGWIRTLFQDPAGELAALRARAMPRIAEDSTRVPDHIFSGPDLPLDEHVRARFFGEC